MIRTITFKILLGVYFVLWSPILLVGLISKRLNHFLVHTCAGGVMLLARIVAGIKYKVHFSPTEEQGIPLQKNKNIRLDGKAIVAAKHMSILEIAILEKIIPNAFFIVKREIMWFPIYGWAFRRYGLLPVNRAKGATNMRKLTEAVEQKILDGQTLIIFPEGTRAKPGQKVPIKRGLMFLASHLKLPILPVSADTGLYWPKKGKMKSGTANIYIEPLLPCNASMEEISEAINRHSA